MTPRSFHLGDVLSVTTGLLVAPGHMSTVQELIEYVVDEPVFTHQLGRASDLIKSTLLEQHPTLAAVEAPDFSVYDREEVKAAVDTWLAEQVALYGEHLEVEPLPPGPRRFGDPLGDFARMRGSDGSDVVAVVVPDA